METAIYATIYANSLDDIEIIFKNIFQNNNNFKKIEQGNVLIYESKQIEISIEHYNNSFYLSGRLKKSLSDSLPIIINITKCLKDNGLKFSLDYQEENERGEAISIEFNISS